MGALATPRLSCNEPCSVTSSATGESEFYQRKIGTNSNAGKHHFQWPKRGFLCLSNKRVGMSEQSHR